VIKFITKNSSYSTFHTGYKEKYKEETVNTDFLGLQIDAYLNWKNHIEQIIHKLEHVMALGLWSNQFIMYLHTVIQL